MRVPCSELGLVAVLLTAGWASVSGLHSLAKHIDRPDDFPLWHPCPPRCDVRHVFTMDALLAAWDLHHQQSSAASGLPASTSPPAPAVPPAPLVVVIQAAPMSSEPRTLLVSVEMDDEAMP